MGKSEEDSVRVAIVGSRQGVKLAKVQKFVHDLAAKYPDAVVISGGAKGVDTAAVEDARAYGLRTEVYPADWDRHGKSAGFRRNRQIVAAADVVVAFWNGESRGWA